MTRLCSIVVAAVAASISGADRDALQAQGGTGTIVGHVRLTGPAPANPIIRMGGDPRCSRALAGKRVTQDAVLRSADGGLANAFVSLQGSFRTAAAPTEPVTIDQRDCIFVPRVVGVRVGQTLQFTNSDPTSHNVHSLSDRGNAFNVSQPAKYPAFKYQPTAAEVVMRIRCDIHTWMISYVGVFAHPYFAVSGADGAFRIANVPAGRHTIQIWHEQYGPLTRTVDVKPGQTATVDVAYTGKEKAGKAGIVDLVIPGHA